MSESEFLPVHALASRIGAGGISSAELVGGLLERIDRYDEKLHAFVRVYADEARTVARAADHVIQAGHAVGPYHGVPIALKDIIDIEGRVTTGGSKAWCERISPITATLVERLIAAGMIVIGKTHSVEFALGSWGTNQQMGTPWNPWDLDIHRAPGGSSAGSAVAVAAGLAPWAIGTDTGGSVRLPAAWCGLVGLKTTIGRISTHGVLPLSPTLDTPGPICRSVEDAALLYNVLQGPDVNDPRTLVHPADDPVPSMKRGCAGLRLARIPDSELEGVELDVLTAYQNSLELLTQLGARMVDVALPRRFADLGALVGRIIGAEGYSIVGDLVDDMSLPLDDDVRPRFWIGKEMLARDYLLALRERDAIKREFAQALADVDALLTPTIATAAPAIDSIDQSTTAANFTRPVNLLEWCALALPNGLTSGGLPTSLQIVCGSYDEGTALRIGWAYEQATEWHERRPASLINSDSKY